MCYISCKNVTRKCYWWVSSRWIWFLFIIIQRDSMPQLSFSSPCAAGGVLWLFQVTFSLFNFLLVSDNDTQANPHLFPCTSPLDLFLCLIFPQSCYSRRVSCWDCSSAIYEQDWCLEFPEVPGERQAQRPLVYNSGQKKKKKVKGNEIWARAFRDNLTSQLPC